MMTEEQLAELERLEKAATPGEWSASDASSYDAGTNIEIGAKGGLYVASITYDAAFVNPAEHLRGKADADLIAAFRNALPSLVATIRELRARAEAAERPTAPVAGSEREAEEADATLLREQWWQLITAAGHGTPVEPQDCMGVERTEAAVASITKAAAERDQLRERSEAALAAKLAEVSEAARLWFDWTTSRCDIPDRPESERRAMALRSALAAPPSDALRRVREEAGAEALAGVFDRRAAWSLRTFGAGDKYKGVVEHIRRELAEIEADPSSLVEWVDVVMLAMDGALERESGAAAMQAALSASLERGVRLGLEAAAFECEDRARTSEGEALQADQDGRTGDASWFRARARRDRDMAARIREQSKRATIIAERCLMERSR